MTSLVQTVAIPPVAVRDRSAGLKARAQEAVRALERARGLRIAWLEDQPADREFATETVEASVGRPPPA